MFAHSMTHGLNLGEVTIQTASATVTMANAGAVVINQTSGAPIAVTLPPNPGADGTFPCVMVKDGKGDAATNNITISGAAAATIDGASTYVLSENYAGAIFLWNKTEWSCIGTFKENITQATGSFTTLTAPTIAGTTAFTGHITTTDGVASGTAKVIGGTAFENVIPSSAVASTTVETLFDQNYSIPAGTLKAGSMVRIRYQGIATTVVGSDTIVTKLYLGGLSGTALCTCTATAPNANGIFQGEVTLNIRTAGNSGTFVGQGRFVKVPNISGTATEVAVSVASTAVNTNAAQVVGVSCTWNTTNANSCRLDVLSVEIY
jgi:hypothetical protein